LELDNLKGNAPCGRRFASTGIGLATSKRLPGEAPVRLQRDFVDAEKRARTGARRKEPGQGNGSTKNYQRRNQCAAW
jgi:hypothetical protein